MMRVQSTGPRWALLHGDACDVRELLPAAHFDAVLCDPPYGFSFMGKGWDYQVPAVATWRAILECLKPGAPILAFGGTRTYHRLVVNLEDAGAEIRDQLTWLYGSGFPKSQNAGKALDAAAGVAGEVVGTRTLTGNAAISTAEKGGTYASNTTAIGRSKEVDVTRPGSELGQQWEGYGTALKPAVEPIVLARKPLAGTMAQNIATHGCGPLAIDACRIEAQGRPLIEKTGERWGGSNMDAQGSKAIGTTDVGRWPANLLLDEAAGAALDAQTGKNESRFFYCAKASKSEREAGLDHLPVRSGGEMTDRKDGSAGLDSPRAGAGRGGGRRNIHPTVKPLELLRYLARLVKPAGPTRRILVPFAGCGSEMVAALLEGFDEVVGVELDADAQGYHAIAEARLRHWIRP